MSSTGDDGFTIVELIVVIAIITALSTLIVPRMYTSGGSTRLDTAAVRLVAAAHYARDYAVTRRVPCKLVIDAAEHRYVLACPDEEADKAGQFKSMRTGIGKAEYLGAGVEFSKVWIKRRADERVQETVSEITFQPTGGADAAVVEITNGKGVYSMLVAAGTARAELVKGVVNEMPDDRIDLDE